MYIFLTGFMASGKTKNGRIMAERLGYDFIDLDHLLEEIKGKKINEIHKELGEAEFRKLELKTLLAHTKGDGQNIIFSLGGGAYTSPKARKWLRKKGKTIFIDVPVRVLYHRLLFKKTTRPLLRGLSDEELLQKIIQLRDKRLADYMEADYVLSDFRGTYIDRLALEKIIREAR